MSSEQPSLDGLEKRIEALELKTGAAALLPKSPSDMDPGMSLKIPSGPDMDPGMSPCPKKTG